MQSRPTMKASHFFLIVCTIGPLYWGYENYRLVDRIDSAFDAGHMEYSETITSHLCLGLRVGFFKTEHDAEFSIFDRDGKAHTEKFQKSTIGACRRHRPYRAIWTKRDA